MYSIKQYEYVRKKEREREGERITGKIIADIHDVRKIQSSFALC